jgi:hypothetical protein
MHAREGTARESLIEMANIQRYLRIDPIAFSSLGETILDHAEFRQP